MDRRDTERVIRMAISSANSAADRLALIDQEMRMKGQKKNELIPRAIKHYVDAEKLIRDWSKANGFTVEDAMQT